MKKRVLSILLSFVMVLGLIPSSAFVDAAASGEHGSHCICGASDCSDTKHGGKLEWKPISSLNSIDTAGNYYLTQNVTISSGVFYLDSTVGPVNLCLNGKTITWTGAASAENKYAAIVLTSGASLTITDCHSDDEVGKIIRTSARSNSDKNGDYSLIYNENGTLNLWNGCIGGNKAGIGVDNYGVNSIFNMYGGSIANNDSVRNGNGGGVYNYGKFNMYGGSIEYNAVTGGQNCGGAVFNLGKFNMTGGSIAHNTNHNTHGGGVCNKGTFTMTGGSILDNYSSYYGGGVFNYGTFTMTDGSIRANSALQVGGGVANCGTFEMSDGSILYNTVNDAGGGVFNYPDRTFTMTGGSITQNNTKKLGGGVDNRGIFNLSGKPTITGNKKDGAFGTGGTLVGGTDNNVYIFDNNFPIIAAGLASGAKVGINGADGTTVVTGTTSATGFFSDDASYELKYNRDNGLKLVQYVEHNDTHCICGQSNCTDTAHGGALTWTAWDGTSEIVYDTTTKTAYVYLTQSVKRAEPLVVESGYTLYLCLNGNDITYNAAGGISVVKVQNDANLTITDCRALVGRITHGYNTSEKTGKTGSGIHSWGALTLWNGCITGNNAGSSASGGGVYIETGTFTMNGGSITDNITESKGGGVYIKSGTTFIMTGGSITDNTADSNGGGVYNGGTFEMSGTATVSDNTGVQGGGVYNDNIFKMSGAAAITDNIATSSGGGGGSGGGGVCNQQGTFEMSGGEIKNNKASSGYGGGVNNTTSSKNNPAKFTMSGGSITGNSTGTGTGGGGVNNYYSEFTMSGAAAIDNNTACGGGGVDNFQGTFNMNGGEIKNNISSGGNGGGVCNKRTYDSTNTVFNMSAGTISGNSTTISGGGVYNGGSATFNMSGGEIIGNTSGSDSSGGGVYNGYGIFTVSGNVKVIDNVRDGTITNGTLDGGTINNVYLSSLSPITVESGKSLSADASIGVSGSLNQTVVTGTTDTTGFFSDKEGYCLKDNENGGLKLQRQTQTHCVCGETNCPDSKTHGEAIEWKAWGSLTSPPSDAGNWYLMHDVTLSDTWEVRANINLCLNGKTITGVSGKNTITIAKSASLTITDCHSGGDVGKITHKSGETGCGIYNSGTLTLWNGTITGNTDEKGAGVYNCDTFHMYGGTIAGNTATKTNDYGGGGVLNDNGTFNMSGGTITGNTALNRGGGVYNYEGTFTMSGGSITLNKVNSSGGGLYNYGTVNMTGGSITKNTCGSGDSYGGGAYNAKDFYVSGNVNISGNVKDGTIDENGELVGGEANNLHVRTLNYRGTIYHYPITVAEAGMGDKANVGISGTMNYIVVKGTTDTKGFSSDNTEYVLKAAENEGLKLCLNAVVSGKLLVKNGGEEMADDAKIYDGNSVVFANAAVISGSSTVSGAAYTYKWEKKGENGEYTVITGLTGFTGPSDAGEYKLTVTATKNSEELASKTLSFTIEKKELTVNVTIANKTYDGTDKATFGDTPTLRGVVSGEDVTLVSGTPRFTGVATGDNIAISFTEFTLSGADVGNYTLIQPTGITANIIPYTSDKSEYKVNSNDWLNSDFVVTAEDGWQLSYTNTAEGEWVDTLTVSQETNNGTLHFYVRNKESGIISEMIAENYKIDKTVPTGEIRINERTFWENFWNTITFGLFYKDSQTVTISADDIGSGVKTVEYLMTADDLSIEQLAGKSFTAYENSFGIEPDTKLIVYAKITDNAGNVTYLRTDGIVLDATAPVINGADNDKTYCAAVTLTITDEYLDLVTVNGKDATLTDGKLTLAPAAGKQTVVATDKAGNQTTITVTVNNGHTWTAWSSNGDGTHSRTCTVDAAHIETADCHGGTATCQTKAICTDCHQSYGDYGEHDWNMAAWDYQDADGHAHTCKTEGCTEHDTVVAHTKDRDAATENDPVKCTECGYVIAKALGHICANHLTLVEAKAATCTAPGNTAYYECSCGKFYEDATASVEITDHDSVITAALNHDWAAATCTEPKTCKREGCGATDGNPLGHNYSTDWSRDASSHWHDCQNEGCTDKANFAKHTPGAAATETTDQTCTECGYVIAKALGHICANHLTAVAAKAATCTEPGNTAYYECSCGKFYEDATASVEITDHDSIVIKALDHDWAAATCTEPKTCKREGCGATDGNPLGHKYATDWSRDASGHWHDCQNEGCTDKANFAKHTPGAAATETTDQTCTECGYVITPALGHICANHLTAVAAKAATCTEAGNTAYYECSCGKFYEDATASVEITDHDSVVIKALGHDWAAATCTEPKTCKREGCGVTEGNPLGHNYAAAWSRDASGHWHACQNEGCTDKADFAKHTPGEDATETTDQTCTECGYVITPAFGHICANHLTAVAAKAATCTKAGNTAYYECSCGKLYADATASVELTEAQTVIAVHNHDYEWKIDREATATKNGSKHEECTVCHDKKAAVEIPATGDTHPKTDETSPQTGDDNGMNLWIALLFVSGAGITGTMVYSKKKRSVK